MTDVETLRTGWDQAAREDAMGNIITIPGLTPDGFWQRGRDEIDAMIAHLDDLELRGENRSDALDFGCGVGRLTIALTEHYNHVEGVDVSGEMIARAQQHERVSYCRADSLAHYGSGDFDLIYSRIVLQHMPQDLQRGYVGEFVRLLAPGGLAVFQIPDGPDYEHPNAWLSMYGVSRETVEGWVEDAGARLLDVELLEDASPTWLAYRYTVTP